MPIYEYRCEECGADHEALRRISDPPLTTCPACGAEALRKRVSAAGFRLAGTGWYETDFKSKDRQRNLAGGGKDEAKPSGDAGKADAKPAASDSKPTKAAAKSDGGAA